MAIKYVDIEPSGDAKAKRPDKPEPRREPPVDATAASADAIELTHAKPTPKPRGRKKPLK